MRKLVVANIMSLDGYYTGPDDNIMVMPMDPSFDAHNVARLREADTLLLGRKTYEGFRSFWPSVVDSPDATDENREISRRDNEIEKVVISDTLTPDPTRPWYDTTRIVPRSAAHAEIEALKAKPGKDILVFGSQVLWRDLLAHGLVDELYLVLGGTVVGGGRPIFGPDPVALTRLDVGVPANTDNTILRYGIRR
jgi:dihydrofolate reductase